MHAPATPTSSATTVHTMLSRGVWALRSTPYCSA